MKGFATDLYKFNLVIGYGIFYTFVVCTTESPIAFTYVLPVTSLLVLYKNKKFMIGCGIANSLIIVGSAAYRIMLGYQSAANMKEVEASNLHLVDNLKQVSGIVGDMTNCIADSNEINNRMLSKYEESANNINSIELVIESLMCELGIGGFMGMEDVLPGMKLTITLKNAKNYYGEVLARENNTLSVSLTETPDISDVTECKLQVTVGNVLYCWDTAKIVHTAKELSNHFTINIESRPKANTRVWMFPMPAPLRLRTVLPSLRASWTT